MQSEPKSGWLREFVGDQPDEFRPQGRWDFTVYSVGESYLSVCVCTRTVNPADPRVIRYLNNKYQRWNGTRKLTWVPSVLPKFADGGDTGERCSEHFFNFHLLYETRERQ